VISIVLSPQAIFKRKRRFLAVVSAVIGLVSAGGPAQAAQDLAPAFDEFAKGSQEQVDHDPWDQILKTYVVSSDDGINRFRYGDVSAEDRATLSNYLNTLQTVDPAGLDRSEQFAYWANLYNALTVKLVLDHYPVSSIRKIKFGWSLKPGPWDEKLLTVKGHDLSLNNIEHDILRPILQDVRVHYALNCASISCPNLWPQAFTGADLKGQLKAAMSAYVNHPRGVSLKSGSLQVSSIYVWYRQDFGGTDEAVIAHLKAHAAPDLVAALGQFTEISGHDYDWALNDATAASSNE